MTPHPLRGVSITLAILALVAFLAGVYWDINALIGAAIVLCVFAMLCMLPYTPGGNP